MVPKTLKFSPRPVVLLQDFQHAVGNAARQQEEDIEDMPHAFHQASLRCSHVHRRGLVCVFSGQHVDKTKPCPATWQILTDQKTRSKEA